ncbi:MAG: hypothetical protein AAB288_08075 [Acidobacteriota bacterium]
MKRNRTFAPAVLIAAVAMTGCSGSGPGNSENRPANNSPMAESPKPEGTASVGNSPTPAVNQTNTAPPAQGFTEADLAKIKWLEGTWRGSYKTAEYFQRMTFKGSRILIETFTDGTLKKKGPPATFELKNGELIHSTGEQRWKAISITDEAVQFVPADPPKPGEDGKASFKFERQPGNTWRAILETPETPTKPPLTKVYKMEPWSPPAK